MLTFTVIVGGVLAAYGLFILLIIIGACCCPRKKKKGGAIKKGTVTKQERRKLRESQESSYESKEEKNKKKRKKNKKDKGHIQENGDGVHYSKFLIYKKNHQKQKNHSQLTMTMVTIDRPIGVIHSQNQPKPTPNNTDSRVVQLNTVREMRTTRRRVSH